MAINLTDGSSGLFDRLGKLFYAISSANSYLGSGNLSSGGLDSIGTSLADILTAFNSNQDIIDGIHSLISNVRSSSLSSLKSDLARIATQTVIDMVHDDATLDAKTIDLALAELESQMIGSGTLYAPDDDVDASVPGQSVAAGSGNTGTGVCIASVVRADGRNNELVFAETITVKCTSDAQTATGATERQEAFSVKGDLAVTDALAYNWPGGSAVSTSLSAADASIDAQEDVNLLTNSDFDTTSPANEFTSWDTLVGAAGTDIVEEASTVYRSGKALEFVGDASTLSSIAQTITTLEPSTVYAINFFARKSASLAAGVLDVDLVNGSNATVADDASTNNLVQVAYSTLTTSYAAYNGFFRTPSVLPTTLKIRVRLSTAATSSESVFVDDLCLRKVVPIYTGGPYVAVFAGATNFVLNDVFTATITNGREGAFQEWFDRIFDMKSKGRQLVSDSGSSETIGDALIA